MVTALFKSKFIHFVCSKRSPSKGLDFYAKKKRKQGAVNGKCLTDRRKEFKELTANKETSRCSACLNEYPFVRHATIRR